MPNASARPNSRSPLRAAAEARLISGIEPTQDSTISMQSLELLFRLACSPNTAADGLKLLHELQVHQVEIDLQQAELETSERDACNRLDHYKTLYELAPAGYLVTDPAGRIAEANAAAAALLGIDRKRLAGLMLETVLAPAGRPVFGELRQQLLDGAARASIRVEWPDRDRDALQVVASLAPTGDALLVILTAA